MRTARIALAAAAGFAAAAAASAMEFDDDLEREVGMLATLALVENTTCLDGSRAAYYYAPPKSQEGVWVVHLAGGGLCTSVAECAQRAKTDLGSSKRYATQTRLTYNTLVDDPTKNPGFADAHHVFVKYCTGDTHRGTRAASAASGGLAFTGHTNLLKIFAELEAKYGFLSTSTHVLLSGSSAGGAGAFGIVDVLASMFTSKPVFKAAPAAGLFLPLAVDSDEAPPANYTCFAGGKTCGYLQLAPALTELWGTYRNEACAAANPGDDGYYCESVGYFMKYIKTPMYVLEHQYDTNQLFAQQGLPRDKNPTTIAYAKMYGAAMRRTTALNTRDVDGLFSPSCGAHGVSTATLVNGVSWPPVLADWFWEQGKYTASYKMSEECDASANGLPCNAQKSCNPF